MGKFGPFLGAPGPNLGAPRFSKLVQNLRLGPPTARSTFVPLCSNRLGPPEPSDRHFGQLGLFLGRFWALEVPNLTNFVSGKWNEARGTLRVEKNKPVDPNGKKISAPPPLNPLWAVTCIGDTGRRSPSLSSRVALTRPEICSGSTRSSPCSTSCCARCRFAAQPPLQLSLNSVGSLGKLR